MSELKGMKIYMAVDPQEDGTFFIKKSIRDGSLAVFDEEIDAVSQVKRNNDNTEFREGFIVRPETKKKIESEIERLTAIATKHATRADELYETLETVLLVLEGKTEFNPDEISTEGVREVLDKSRIEAEKSDGICN